MSNLGWPEKWPGPTTQSPNIAYFIHTSGASGASRASRPERHGKVPGNSSEDGRRPFEAHRKRHTDTERESEIHRDSIVSRLILQRHCQFSTLNLQLPGKQPERDRELFFIKDFIGSASCSLIDVVIIWIRKFCCDEKFFDLGKRLSLRFKSERQPFDRHFVAPSVDPCAIVACDCLQWSLHPHHVLSPPVPAAGYNQEKDEIDDVTDS